MQRRCRKQRNYWIERKCKEVEKLFRLGKVDAAHREIRENFRERQINANIVRDESGIQVVEHLSKSQIRNHFCLSVLSIYKSCYTERNPISCAD